MKEKLLAELKKKFPGLPVEFLGLFAEKMALKVTEDTQIEGAIAELDNLPVPIPDLAAQFQRDGDRRAREAANTRENSLKEKFNFVEKSTTETKPTPPSLVENPQIAELLNEMKALREERAAEQKAKSREVLLGKVKAKFGDKSIPDFCFTGVNLEKEEDVEAAYQQVETNYNNLKQHFVDQGFSQNTVPLGGSLTGGKESVSTAMLDYLKDKKPETK